MRSIAASAAIALLTSIGAAAPGAVAGGWTVGGNLSTQRPGQLLAVSLTDGRVLLTGASSDDYSGLGNVDIYDQSQGWSRGPRLAADPVLAVAAPLPNGGALLAGGWPYLGGFDGPGPGPTAKAMTFDPSRAAWTAAPDMSTPRNGATATPLPDGRVLVAGGYDRTIKQLPNPNQQPFCCLQVDFIPLASAEIFDPSTRRWSPTGSLAEARSAHRAVALKDGRVLVVAGQKQPDRPSPLTSAEVFDPSTGRWTGAGDTGEARTGFTLTALAGGGAILAGGLAADGATLLRTTLIYDPTKNAWSPGADMHDARTNHSAASLKDGRVLVTGGLDYLGRLATSELFDPTTQTWTATGALQTARSDAAAVGLPDGRIIVAGGRSSNGPLADSEIFDANGPGGPPVPRTVGGPGRWLAAAPQPVPNSQETLRVLRDGRVLVLPGSGYADYAALVYNLKSTTWTTPIRRQSDRVFMAGVALNDDKVLLLTLPEEGQTPGKAEVIDLATGVSHGAASPGALGSARLELLADGRVWLTQGIVGDKRTFYYDPAADRWSSGPDLPNDLFVSTVTPIPGGRLLIGGYLQAMILDPATGTWSLVASYPARWSNYSATRLPGGDVLLAGGSEDKVQTDGRILPAGVTRVMRWNHVTGTLSPAAFMTAARSFHSTVVLRDGRVLFAGGVSGDWYQSDPVPTAEIYDPVKDRWSSAQSMPEARSYMSAALLTDGTVLEVGGFGVFNPPHTLSYAPEAAAAPKAAAAAASQSQTVALAVGVTTFIVAVVISWLLIASARRRRSAR